MAILSEPPGARRVREGMPYNDVMIGRKWHGVDVAIDVDPINIL